MELKVDKDGLLYIDDNTDMYKRLLNLDHRNVHEYFANNFFSIPGTKDYIIKKPLTIWDKRLRERYKEMLIKLVERQKLIKKTDFPIGYQRENRKMEGLIVRYYEPSKTSISLDQIKTKECFERAVNKVQLLKQYYFHDEDDIHNFFLFLLDVLDAIYEMFENGVYYIDINPGNIVFYQNNAKIIDFDPSRVTFDNKDLKLQTIMKLFVDLVNMLLEDYELYDYVDATLHNFEEAKTFTKRIEEKARRYR